MTGVQRTEELVCHVSWTGAGSDDVEHARQTDPVRTSDRLPRVATVCLVAPRGAPAVGPWSHRISLSRAVGLRRVQVLRARAFGMTDLLLAARLTGRRMQAGHCRRVSCDRAFAGWQFSGTIRRQDCSAPVGEEHLTATTCAG